MDHPFFVDICLQGFRNVSINGDSPSQTMYLSYRSLFLTSVLEPWCSLWLTCTKYASANNTLNHFSQCSHALCSFPAKWIAQVCSLGSCFKLIFTKNNELRVPLKAHRIFSFDREQWKTLTK